MLPISGMRSRLPFILPAPPTHNSPLKNRRLPVSARISSVCPLGWKILKIFSGIWIKHWTRNAIHKWTGEHVHSFTYLPVSLGVSMPVKIPTTLPARATLELENIFVMDEERANHQDIR